MSVVPEQTQVCQRSRLSASESDVCWRMLTYTDVCWRMLSYESVYVDVCWRVLKYARGHVLVQATQRFNELEGHALFDKHRGQHASAYVMHDEVWWRILTLPWRMLTSRSKDVLLFDTHRQNSLSLCLSQPKYNYYTSICTFVPTKDVNRVRSLWGYSVCGFLQLDNSWIRFKHKTGSPEMLELPFLFLTMKKKWSNQSKDYFEYGRHTFSVTFSHTHHTYKPLVY